MALQMYCTKHNVSYIAPDITIAQDGKPYHGPICPECRKEWECEQALKKARNPNGYHIDEKEE